MRGALRSHIIKKRNRLKQELEQDAIEKRLKKERELKRIQDAMTLDQIKEQLSSLEKRLENLKSEKHNLFLQLKQVLNEGNSKRKQDELEAQKRQKTDTDKTVSSATTVTTSNNATNNSFATSNHHPHQRAPATTSYSHVQDFNTSANFQYRPSLRQLPPQTPLNRQRIPLHIQHNTSHASPILGMPILSQASPSVYSDPGNYPRQNPAIRAQSSALQANFRNSLIGPMPEFMPLNLLDPGHQRMSYISQRLPTNAMLIDVPLSLSSLHHHDPKMLYGISGKRSMSTSNLNGGQVDERSLARKPNSFSVYPNLPNPFLMEGLPPHGLPPNLAHLNLLGHASSLNPSTSVDASPLAEQGMIQNSFHSRRPPPQHMTTNFDYLLNQNKPNILVPGFGSFYPTQPSPSLMPPTSIYPGVEADFKHFSHLYHPATQQYDNTSHFNSPQFSQHEQASRLYAANYHRKTSPKNPYNPNK